MTDGKTQAQKLLRVSRFRPHQLGSNNQWATGKQKNDHRIREIEDGGALPRWGPVPN
jgi:hypothetical protein